MGSNGKIDKRVLRDKALAQIELERKAKEAATQLLIAKTKDDASSHSSGSSTPTVPPMSVYKTDATGSEKKVDYEHLSVVEKEVNAWDGYEDEDVPEKTQGKLVRNLRHQIFSLYRRFFGVVFAANMGVLIATFVRGKDVNADHLGLIVVANLFCSILMRQEYVVNAIFTIVCCVPQS